MAKDESKRILFSLNLKKVVLRINRSCQIKRKIKVEKVKSCPQQKKVSQKRTKASRKKTKLGLFVQILVACDQIVGPYPLSPIPYSLFPIPYPL